MDLDIDFETINGWRDLNSRQQKFCLGFLKSGSATQAAKDAGYSPKSAEVIGAKLRKHIKVRAVLAELRRALWKSEALTIDESQAICARIARARLGDYMAGGEVNPALVQNGDQAVESFSAGNEDSGPQVKLRDPIKAIKLAAELAGWTKKDDANVSSVGSVNYFFGFRRGEA